MAGLANRLISKGAAFVMAGLVAAMAGVPAMAGDGWIDVLPQADATTVLDQAGTYQLVGDVTMADPKLDCIQIAADDVTLDLNGHTISGAGGAGIGIQQTDGIRAVVYGGTVRMFGGGGIQLGDQAHIHDTRVMMCGPFGIELADSTLVEDNALYNSRANILVTGYQSVISNNSVWISSAGGQCSPVGGGCYALVIGASASATIVRNNTLYACGTWIDDGLSRSVYIHSGGGGIFASNIGRCPQATPADTVGPGSFVGVIQYFSSPIQSASDNVWFPG